jgi:hypothetical protein
MAAIETLEAERLVALVLDDIEESLLERLLERGES